MPLSILNSSIPAHVMISLQECQTVVACKQLDQHDVEQEVARHDVEAILEEWIKTGVVDR